MRRAAAVVMILGMAVGGAVACFSERGGTAPTAGAECRVPIGSQVPGSTLVVIRNFAFEPASVTVRAGSTITWVNCDQPGQPAHTSTADGGAWNSPTLGTGEAYSRSFDQAGTFDYHCEPHPFMVASVTAE